VTLISAIRAHNHVFHSIDDAGAELIVAMAGEWANVLLWDTPWPDGAVHGDGGCVAGDQRPGFASVV